MFENTPKIFLAANSADGFINRFQAYTCVKENFYTYIIKGGPGTGKSSFMKRIANRALDNGENVIISPCSSDTDSLDAVILNDRKIMILDGTAPHTVDPVYPGVSEEILNFGEFWDGEMLRNQSAKIVEVSEKNKLFHKRASLCISAAGRVKRDNMKISLIAADIEKIVEKAEKTAKRYIVDGEQNGNETICFLSAVSPSGNIFCADTVDKMVSHKVIITDELGTASNIFMSIVRDIALAKGYDIITVKNNILPSEKTDHIIVPKADVAFCTENSSMQFESEDRRIRTERFLSAEQLAKSSKRIKFNKKLEKEFLNQAVQALKLAKSTHDELESFYIKAMDFNKANAFSESFLKKIFEK